MDTIREYLNNMFLGFPETPAVLRAKAELLEMMEDKFEECLQEGKSEKEAVGIVISEFGNIEEIAEELGIADYLHEAASETKGTESGKETFSSEDGKNHENRADQYQSVWTNDVQGTGNQNIPSESWSFSQTNKYVSYTWKHGIMIAAGVACFILSCFFNSAFDTLGDFIFFPSIFMRLSGNFFFMGGIAVGVLLLVYAGRLEKTYPVVKKRRRILVDTETAEYMKKQRVTDEDKCFRMRIVGILLLVFLWAPAAVADEVLWMLPVLKELVGDSTLLMIAAGVFLIVAAGSVENRYQEFAKAAVMSGENGFERDSNFGDGNGFSAGQGQSGPEAWQNEDKVFAGYQKKKRGWVPAIIITAVVIALVFLAIRVARVVYRGIHIAGNSIVSEVADEAAEEREQHGSYASDAVNDIQIDLDTDDVLVQSGETEKIIMDYRGRSWIKESLKNGVLEFKERNKNNWFGIHFFDFVSGKHGSFVLTLPKSVYGSYRTFDGGAKISINTDTGNVQMKEICFSGISIDADTGDVTLSDTVSVESGISVDADTGDVNLKDVTGKKITVDADTGDVTVDITTTRRFFGEMECDLDTGDFLLKMPISKEDFLRTFGTDFSTDLENRVQFFGEKMSASQASQKHQGQEKMLKVSTDTGSITVEQKQ